MKKGLPSTHLAECAALCLTLSGCVSSEAIVLSAQAQDKIYWDAVWLEEKRLGEMGIDSPLTLPGPFARRPARCSATSQKDVFVCRTITMERETSLWKAQDIRFRRYGQAWAYDPALYSEIQGPYRLAAPDGPASTHICYDQRTDCLERIPGVVFTWGADKHYVVAARHPQNPDTGEIDKLRTEYFYIDRRIDDGGPFPSRAVRGPFSVDAFATERLRLNLPPMEAYDPTLK
ncbi:MULTISPECIES: hypothetical protein [unclassified Caulobacter]|uniref:hypothetical protein n=1 Tax=unclassified Caulobacter TaxID=2648921 RepID=UPI000D3318C8|nr:MULTISPECIES: hypothetical protein [unclassified Caulobacter]PTS84521.1 hypothetical protein DBR21_15800 [Caulobacter sp. HMWF009]PTT08765.1 hypothetical protein DBR10_08440 [Caulobacter sp. HMWF025]PTT75837.1 hypothetical protein DBR41_25825 [Pseudomonas sp. HMWF010]